MRGDMLHGTVLRKVFLDVESAAAAALKPISCAV